MRQTVNIFLLFALGINIILMLSITLPYLSFDPEVGFLRIKHWIYGNSVWRTAFFVHVFSAIFLLLAGFTQFSGFIIRRYRMLHRYMGMLYVFVLMFLAGPSGIIMSFYANGKLPAQISFTLLSTLWISSTFMAYRTAIKRQFVQHGMWMIVSFALTLSAITLRIWKPLLAINFHIPPRDLYVLVSWLGWIPNLLVALILIKKKAHHKLLQQ